MSRKIVIINVRKYSRLVAEASETRTKAVQNHVGNNDKIFPFISSSELYTFYEK